MSVLIEQIQGTKSQGITAQDRDSEVGNEKMIPNRASLV